jgi:hypothetical protein
MKRLLISLCLVLSLRAPAQEKAPAAPTLEQYTATSNKILDLLDEYNKQVATVKDLPTAKAAKPKIEALTAKMTEATKAAAALGKPTPEQEKALSTNQNMERVGKIHKEMSMGGRVIVQDKAIFAELQPTLALFQRAMRGGGEKSTAAAK